MMKLLQRAFCKIFGHQYFWRTCLRCGASAPDKEAEVSRKLGDTEA